MDNNIELQELQQPQESQTLPLCKPYIFTYIGLLMHKTLSEFKIIIDELASKKQLCFTSMINLICTYEYGTVEHLKYLHTKYNLPNTIFNNCCNFCITCENNDCKKGKEKYILNIDNTDDILINRASRSPIHNVIMTSRKNNIKLPILQYLLEVCKVNIDAVDSYGYTALFYAVNNLNIDAVEYLLINDANANHKSKKGHTPLHVACISYEYNNYIEQYDKSNIITCIIDFLINIGISDVNAKYINSCDDDGDSCTDIESNGKEITPTYIINNNKYLSFDAKQNILEIIRIAQRAQLILL